MIRFLIQVVINAAALGIAVWLLDGVNLTAGSGIINFTEGNQTLADALAFLLVGLIFGLINSLIRPIISFLSLPITCLTLGLFSLVINVLMLLLTAWLSEFTPAVLTIENFWWGLGASVIISLISAVLGWLVPKKED